MLDSYLTVLCGEFDTFNVGTADYCIADSGTAYSSDEVDAEPANFSLSVDVSGRARVGFYDPPAWLTDEQEAAAEIIGFFPETVDAMALMIRLDAAPDYISGAAAQWLEKKRAEYQPDTLSVFINSLEIDDDIDAGAPVAIEALEYLQGAAV